MTKISELKEENIRAVRSCLYRDGIWTKNRLSLETGLSLAGTTKILQYLLKNDEILLSGKADSTGGRKSKQYILNPDYSHIGILNLHVDENENYCNAIAYSLTGKKLYEKELYGSQKAQILFRKAADSLIEKDPLIKVLSISIPGICIHGRITICDMEELTGFKMGEYIEKRYHLPYIIENDVNTAVLGLARRYPEIKDLVYVFQNSVKYIGCGILIDHKLYNGHSHLAGELRYLPGIPEKEQDRRVKKDPVGLLEEQIATLCAVIDPELVGYSSTCFDNKQISLGKYPIPKEHLPKLIEVNDFFEEVDYGLYAIGMHALLQQ